MEKTRIGAEKPGDVAEVMRCDNVNALGEVARRKTRRLTGERVYYGRLTPAEESTRDEYAEVRLSERDAVGDTGIIDVFVGERDDGFEEYRGAESPVDVAVVYGDEPDAFAERLAEVKELTQDCQVRAVSLVPDGRTTAYTDLKAVAATRLYLDVVGVRVAREDVGEKLAQTSLAYGANDLGFLNGGEEDKEEFDAELAAREAGFTPVDRADVGGYGV